MRTLSLFLYAISICASTKTETPSETVKSSRGNSSHAAFEEFDVCQKIIDPTMEDYRRGIIVTAATGNLDNLERGEGIRPGSWVERCVAKFDFNITEDERIELSYFQLPSVALNRTENEFKTCLKWSYRIDAQIGGELENHCDGYGPKGQIEKNFKHPITSVDLTVEKWVLEYEPYLDIKFLLRKVKTAVEYKYVTDKLEFECSHPNPLLKPILIKGSEDITSRFDVDSSSRKCKISFDDDGYPRHHAAGRYDCTWSRFDTQPTKFVHAIVYDDQVRCHAHKKKAHRS